jgi:hypothetical protein
VREEGVQGGWGEGEMQKTKAKNETKQKVDK